MTEAVMDCRVTTFSLFDLAGGFGFYVFHEVTNEVAHIDHILLVNNRLFTTIVDIAVDGVECAVSGESNPCTATHYTARLAF